MSWTIFYHQDFEDDLKSIGPAAARRVMRAIDAKLAHTPLQFGSPLSGNSGDFRKLRIGDYRVVYQVFGETVTVYVLAAGPRRDKEIYDTAIKRIK